MASFEPSVVPVTGGYFNSGTMDPETIITQVPTFSQAQFYELLQILDSHYHNGEEVVDDLLYEELVSIYNSRFGQTNGWYKAVGAVPSEAGQKVALPYYLSSLSKIKEAGELEKWQHTHLGPYIIEDKVDGITLLIETVNGVLSLYTRGGGTEGLNVSYLAPYLKLPVPPINCAVRGELVMSRQNFALHGQDYRNARGLVAGQMGAQHGLRPDLVQLMSFYAYQIVSGSAKPVDDLRVLTGWGFLIPNPVTTSVLSLELLTTYYQSREKVAPYEMDGVVLYDEPYERYPRNADEGRPTHIIAFKTIGQTATVTVTNVVWQGSRNRLIKPVVEYPMVVLNETHCTRVTGINAKFMLEHQIGPGAVILITKSGNTIPKILAVSAPGNVLYPETEEFGTYTYNGIDFVAGQDTEQMLARQLAHFVTTLGLEGYGETRMLSLVNAGVRDVGSLLILTPAQLHTIPGWGDTLSSHLVNGLAQKVNGVPLDILLDASGMFAGVGRKRFHGIVLALGNQLLMNYQQPQILISLMQQVHGIDTMATTIARKLPGFVAWLQQYPMIKPTLPIAPVVSSSSTGMNATNPSLTGSHIVFSGFRDAQMEQAIEARGGKVASTMSGKTTMVVLVDLSPKYMKSKALEAQNKGLPLISKADFIAQFLN